MSLWWWEFSSSWLAPLLRPFVPLSDSVVLCDRSLVTVDGRLHGALPFEAEVAEGRCVLSRLSDDSSGLAASLSAALGDEGLAVVVDLEGDGLGVVVGEFGVDALNEGDDEFEAVGLAVLEEGSEWLASGFHGLSFLPYKRRQEV